MSEFKRILIPTDGSEFTKAAIENGLLLAKLSGGKATALYVLDQSIYSRSHVDSAVANIYDTLEREGRFATGYVLDRGKEIGVEVEEKIVEGAPARVIAQESQGYDVIVMGTLGRTGMSKLLMGSVAEKVIKESMCPVMVVRSVPSK
ncbi:MAG: universal stress protein [Candidatus Methanoplasma sp.]|jgi:nucleotide-binding universal stress UspA family protein|nr:universal stress protein [Candidatus Methanoplasma sp.]